MTPSQTPPRQRDGRRFGTKISVNSPGPRSSSVKRARVRRSTRTPSPRRAVTRPHSINTTGSSSHFETTASSSYTVTFPPGPVGLQLVESGSHKMVVQGLVEGSSIHSIEHANRIAPGHVVTHVNGEPIQSYAQALQVLQQNKTREITFFAFSKSASLQAIQTTGGKLRRQQRQQQPDKTINTPSSRLFFSPFCAPNNLTTATTPKIQTPLLLSPSKIKEFKNLLDTHKKSSPLTLSSALNSSVKDSPTLVVDEDNTDQIAKVIAGSVLTSPGPVGRTLASSFGEALQGQSLHNFETTVQRKRKLLLQLAAHAQQQSAQTKRDLEKQFEQQHAQELQKVAQEQQDSMDRCLAESQLQLSATERQLEQAQETIRHMQVTQEQTVTELQAQINSLQQALEQAQQKTKDQDDTQMQQKDAALDEWKAKWENLNTKALVQREKLQRALSLKDQQLDDAHVTIGRLQSDWHDTQERLEDERLTAQLAQSQADDWKNEWLQLREQSQRDQETWAQHVDQLLVEHETALQDQQTLLQTELQASMADQEQAQEKCQRLEKELNANQLSWQEQRQDWEKKEAVLVAQVREQEQATQAAQDEARGEIAEWTRQVRTLESSRSLTAREMESLREQNTDLTTRVAKLRDSLDEKENSLSCKRMELLERNGQLEDVRDDLMRTQQEVKVTRETLETTQEQCTVLSDKLSSVVEETAHEKEEMAATVIELQNKQADLEARNSDLDRLLRSLRRSATESDARCTAAREELLREKQALRDWKESSETALTKSKNELQQLQEQVARYRDQERVATEQIHTLRGENTVLCEKMESLKKELAQSSELRKEQDAHYVAERDELEERIRVDRTKANEAAEKLAACEIDANRLRKDLEHQKSQFMDQLQKYETDAELRAQKRTEWLAAKEAEMKQLKSSAEELRQVKSKNIRLEDSLNHARQEVESLKLRTQSLLEDEAAKVAELVKAHDAQIRQLVVDRNGIEEALRKSDEQKDSLETQLFAAEESLSTGRAEREQLIAEKSALSVELHKAEDELVELKNQIETMQQDNLNVSTDSSNGEFSHLSRSELKRKLSEMQDELCALEKRKNEACDDSSRRGHHVQRLVQDLEAMSSSIDQLVNANDVLDSRLQEVRAEKVAAESAVQESKSNEEKIEKDFSAIRLALENQKRKNESFSKSIGSLTNKLALEKQECERLKTEFTKQHEAFEERFVVITKERDEVKQEVDRLLQQLAASEAAKEAASKSIVDLEGVLVANEQRLQQAENYNARKIDEVKLELERSERQVADLEQECGSLRRRVSELEVDLETHKIDLRNKEDSEASMSVALQKCREDLQASDSKQQSTESELASASQCLLSQKGIIHTLEMRAGDAERQVISLSEQMKRLQNTIKKLESSSETNGSFRAKQIEDFEQKYIALDRERVQLGENASALRHELRQARQETAEYKRVNDNLTARIESLKTTVDATKMELLQTRSAKADSAASSKAHVNDLESKQMEIDHLKAKVQVLNATMARMKADYLVLEEVALKEEVKSAASEKTEKELAALKSELETKESELESLTTAFSSQQQMMNLSQSFESQLVRFIDGVISETETVFNEIQHRVKSLRILEREGMNANLIPLDLASLTSSQTKQNAFNVSADSISSSIAKATSYIQGRRSMLNEWKERRPARSPSKPHTPCTPGSFSTPTQKSPTILEAWEKMKSVLQDEVITPSKAHKLQSAQVDAEYLQTVIYSLEGQIDGLLSDLKAANDALRAKDQLFVDLEQLVSHHETERDSLEEKARVMGGGIRDLENKLKTALEQRDTARKELHSQQRSETEGDLQSSNAITAKKAALRLIGNTLDRRTNVTKAVSFRHWACQSAALRAVSQQGDDAEALAQQLENTREKLVILKRHLKKSRRGREPSLDRIMEGYETS